MRHLCLLVLLCLTACAPRATATAVSTAVISPPTAVPSTATHAPPTLAPTATPEPSPTTEPTATAAPAFFEHLGEIVPHGPSGAWDGKYTDPGAVVYADGAFHLFRNGFKNWPAAVSIGYVTSTDGLTWTEPSEDPLWGSQDVPFAGLAALASSVLVEPDGTWVLYFYTWESAAFPTHSRIGRATAPAPTGPWTVDAEPVLTPGPAGAWDSQQVLAPDVFRDGDNGYVMYYSGTATGRAQSIGRATSPDGIHWTKYDDPATTAQAVAASDPVLRPDPAGTWDKSWVHQPRVFQTAAGWVMVYRGVADTNGQRMALGYATSADGLTWERAAANPILTAQAVPGAQYFWFTNALYKDDTLYLFWEVDKNQTTSIYLATHTGPFD